MTLVLSTNNDNENVINKRLTPISSVVNVSLKTPTDTEHPTILLNLKNVSFNDGYDMADANYAILAGSGDFGSIFDGFYYIDKITATRAYMVEITLRLDVLKTFEHYIDAQTAVLKRSSFIFDLDIPDPDFISTAPTQTSYQRIDGRLPIKYVFRTV